MPINTSSLGVRTGKVVTPTHGSGWNYGGVWGNGYIADITPSPVKVAENAIMASGALTYTSVYISNDGVSGATSGTLYGSGNNRTVSSNGPYTLISDSLTTDPDTFTSSGATFSYVCPFTNYSAAYYSQFLMGIRGGTLWVRGFEQGSSVGRVGIWSIPPTITFSQVQFNGWKLTTDTPDFFAGGGTRSGITLGNWHSAVTSSINSNSGSSSRGILFLLNRNGTLWSTGRQTISTFASESQRNGGQLGLGLSGNRIIGPTRIESGTTADWIAVSAGLNHAVGIRGSSGGIDAGSTAGDLWAWGTNLYGQVGDGTTTTRNSPVAIGATGGVWSTVACGGFHTLALKTDGTMWGWGLNGNGQLGLGFTSPAEVTTPTQIGSSGGWAAISAVQNTSFAIRTDGSLWSWGINTNGLLGIGDLTSYNTFAITPTRIGTDNDWARLGTPVDYSLRARQFAIKTDNSLWGWGYNGQGSVGVANSFTKSSGFAQTTTNQFVDVLGNRDGHLGLKSDGSLWVWGTNTSGQFGTGRPGASPYVSGSTYDVFLSPVQATGGSWKEIGQMSAQFSAIRSDGTLWYAGLLGNTYALNWTQLGTASNWTKLTRSPNALHTHALRDNGTLWAWCQNNGNLYAACGIGTTGSAAIVSPVQVGSSGGWIAVASGSGFSIAIREASSGATYGTIWGAGDNSVGGLGNSGAGFPNLNFSQGATGSDWAKISTYSASSFGIKTNGTMWGWGYNGVNDGGGPIYHTASLGITLSAPPFLTQTFTPTQLGSSADWVDVYAGNNCSMAVNSSGVVYGWGHNISQQLTSSGGATYGSFANAYADTPTPITVLTGRKAPPKLCFSESSTYIDYDAYYDSYYYDSFGSKYEPLVFGTFAPITFQA